MEKTNEKNQENEVPTLEKQSNSDSDDDDDGDFIFKSVNMSNIIEITEDEEEEAKEKKKKNLHSLFSLLICLLTRNNVKIKELIEEKTEIKQENDVVQLTALLLEGKYLEIIKRQDSYLKYDDLFQICLTSTQPYEDICRLISNAINSSTTANNFHAELISYQCLLIGYAYFELYCQCNYTGPELSTSEQLQIYPNDDLMNQVSKNILSHLECDGVYAFRLCQIPHTLFIARAILHFLADPSRACWQQGIQLDTAGKIFAKLSSNELDLKTVKATKFLNVLKQWLSMRACVIHTRLLQSQHYTKLPTLWKECEDMMTAIDQKIDEFQQDVIENFHFLPVAVSTNESSTKPHSEFLPSTQIRTLYLLEKGLCFHHFDYSDKGKKLFNLAKDSANLKVTLTAAMGKRTKYQIDDYAQLLLVVNSSLVNKETQADATILKHVVLTQSKVENPNSETKTEWEHGKYELGRRVITEATNGEEVSIRNIKLDDTNGGDAENILFEEGVHFTHNKTTSTDSNSNNLNQEEEGSLSSTLLHPLDQSIILSLCLDVGNSNPVDGLTTEEMHPYVLSILNQYHKHQKIVEDIDNAKIKAAYEMHTQGKTTVVIPEYNPNHVEIYLNWMIYSTALLERSYLEYEKRRTMDRAMLQIQALLDQHTTKLTTFQPDRNLIEDAAAAWERMKYLPCIIYPAQYEIKRDLAERYLRYQVFNSALNLFKELEMWDEVVTCFQLLQKPHRAELLVRERLAAGEETPYMVCALADLTKDESLYIKSWDLSRKRYGRPLRTLARICFDSDRFTECVEYLDQALAVQPLVANAWYLRGIASMRLENWSEAIVSFNRCLQQDMEIGEAWANIGAVQMKMKNWSRAYDALQEAQKHKPREWRILENLMMTTLEMRRLKECIYYMNNLLDLRHLSNRPIHQDELRELIILCALETLRTIREKDRIQLLSSEETKPSPPSLSPSSSPPAAPFAAPVELESLFSNVTKDVENLLFRIMNTLKSENHLWETISMYHTILINGDDPNQGEGGGEQQEGVGFYERQLQLRSQQFLFDVRLKQLRSLVQLPNYERDLEQIHEIIRVIGCLMKAIQDHLDHLTKSDLYSCKSLFSSTQTHLLQFYQKNGKNINEIPDFGKFNEYLEEVDRYYQMKS